MKEKLNWLLMNGLFGVGMYYAYFENMLGVERIVVFWAWVLFVLSFACLNDDFIEKLKERGRVIPCWVDVSYDLTIIAVFVYNGAFITGVAYLIHFFLYTAAQHKAYDCN